jgi:hypothetical protein
MVYSWLFDPRRLIASGVLAAYRTMLTASWSISSLVVTILVFAV